MSPGHQLAARHPEARYVTWAVFGSALVHAGILGFFVLMALLEPAKLDLAQKPVSAKLVRLGVKRDQHLLPRKDIAVPPPPQATNAPQPVAFKPRDPKAAPTRPSNNAAPTKSAEQKRRDLFSAFASTAAAPRPEEPVFGDPEGDLYYLPWVLKADRTRWSGGGHDWTALPAPEPGSGPLTQDYSVIENTVVNAVPATPAANRPWKRRRVIGVEVMAALAESGPAQRLPQPRHRCCNADNSLSWMPPKAPLLITST